MCSTFWWGNDFPKHNIMIVRSMSSELTFRTFLSRHVWHAAATDKVTLKDAEGDGRVRVS